MAPSARRGPGVAAPLAGWLFAAASVMAMGPVEGAWVVAGVALTFAVTWLFRLNPSLAVTLPAILTVAGAALASAQPFRSAGSIAPGSYFVMTMCLAVGMAMRGRGVGRAVWLGLAVVNGVGGWLAARRGHPAGGTALLDTPGAIAAGLFLIWIGAAVVRDMRALAIAPRDARLVGASAGVIVFAIACAIGQASLAGVAALSFWLQFALMMALAGSTLLNDQRSQPFHQ
jgi:hypothetical protein